MSLRTLFPAAAEATFLDCFARKEFALIEGDAEQIGKLVSIDEVAGLLASGTLQAPRIRVSRSGNLVPEMVWTTSDGPVDVPAFDALMDKGATLVVDNLGPLVPRLARLEHGIERRLGSRVLINAYLTFKKGGAFAAHYDNHDVLIVQVRGEKTWEMMAPTEGLAASRRKWRHPLKCPEEVFQKRVLRAGETMLIPRGMWHRASVDEGAMSLHLAVTIVSLNGHDYALWLLEQMDSDDLVWTDIPRLAGDEGLARHGEALQQRIASLMPQYGLDRFLAAMDGERVPDVDLRPFGEFAPRPDDLIVATMRRRLPAAADGADKFEVRASGQTHRLSGAMLAALLAVDRAEGGVTYGELVRRLADRWAPHAVADALRKLAAKGLVATAGGTPA